MNIKKMTLFSFIIIFCLICCSLYFKFIRKDKVLVIYYSLSDPVENKAKKIAELTDADIFEIDLISDYSEDYDEWYDKAYFDYTNKSRPSLEDKIKDFDSYDVVYIGYPIWFNDMTMSIYTILDDYDFSGKVIKPFYYSDSDKGSWTVGEFMVEEKDSIVKDGLAIDYDTSEKELKNWVKSSK